MTNFNYEVIINFRRDSRIYMIKLEFEYEIDAIDYAVDEFPNCNIIDIRVYEKNRLMIEFIR